GNEPLRAARLDQIASDGTGANTKITHLLLCDAQRFRGATGERDHAAFARQRQCNMLADAAGRAGDSGGLASELKVHRVSPPRGTAFPTDRRPDRMLYFLPAPLGPFCFSAPGPVAQLG